MQNNPQDHQIVVDKEPLFAEAVSMVPSPLHNPIEYELHMQNQCHRLCIHGHSFTCHTGEAGKTHCRECFK